MRHVVFRLAVAVLGLALFPAPGLAQSELRLDRWLVLGPVPAPLPGFHDEKPGGITVDLLAESAVFDDRAPRPRPGAAVPWLDGEDRIWMEAPAGSVDLKAVPGTDGPSAAWLATYVHADRFRSAELVLEGNQPRSVWLDGVRIASGKGDDEVKGDVRLTPGKHLLLVQTLTDPEGADGWEISARLVAAEDATLEGLGVGTDLERDMTILDITDPPRVTSLAASPDGKAVAAVLERIIPGTDESESWVEVRHTENSQLRFTWRGFEMSQVTWAPDGEHLTYLTSDESDDGEPLGSLWLVSFKSGKVTALLERVAHLQGYRWSPEGGKIVYWTQTRSEPDERGVKKLEGLLDRQAGNRHKTYLHAVTVPGGVRRRLTAGPSSTTAQDIRPDGKRMLFTRSFDDPSERPYVRTELWEIDLESLETHKLRDARSFRDAQYSPDGKRILVRAGPSEFGDAGVNVSSDVPPNEYDGQLFVWDPAADSVEAITREFDPAVLQAEWSENDGNIYLRAEQGDHVRFFRYSVKRKEFTRIPARFQALEPFDLAREAQVAVATGTSPWLPQGLIRIDLKQDAATLVSWPAGTWFADVRRGRTEAWTFTAASGREIDGRVYLPPDFDESNKYPCIVYYYGGTSPTSRSFGGRYPKEYWAAMGYVVYVLQPSGATGYGQDFSALHVNDWGEIVSEEILEGVEKFLEAHPYVDSERVGCIGASFGGFMTMTLVTKTDRFAAAVAHAGISSIASYWGEGYWGYAYSAWATANSFPWNRPDIYTERSPLASADKVTTPILLTHGRSDTNVPVGESDNFYTALKLVGAPVEYIQIEDQNHTIMDHAKRIVWSRSIVAWFDRWLKDEPEWWDDLYPERE